MSPDAAGLPESRLVTFIDESRQFALYFLEGQKLIHDLAMLHGDPRSGFAWFRDVLLGVQTLIALQKGGEQIGCYVDSERPYFRLKIEAGHGGLTRCALVPDRFDVVPRETSGIVRLLKLYAGGRPPYQSVLDVADLPLAQIANHVLTHSYQVNSEIVVSTVSDQSLMLHQLPPLSNRDEYEYSAEALERRRRLLDADIGRVFAAALTDPGAIREAFSAIGFRELAGREVLLRCSCSRDRMVQNIRLACRGAYDELFDPGDTALEVVCEYCKSRYSITREELEAAGGPN